ncbi:DUF4114 domain-containing protein [Scytonema sp. HK-05]|uniref:DUF4114 domain-containing protein n=1 Tax=Scytonema sp. HK-05 TaxID=1137095 RepID=UPI0030762378
MLVPLAYFTGLRDKFRWSGLYSSFGDKTFGFEGVFGGGDLDYNDVVVQVNFA